jgi:hypothetical protein
LKQLLAIICLRAAGSSVLTLTGTDSTIEFGPTGAKAVLSATCEGATAATNRLSPFETSGKPTAVLNVSLLNVSPTCAGIPATAPCASPPESTFQHPPGFTCHFDGEHGQASTGPFTAVRVEDHTAHGALLGVETLVMCDYPLWTDIERITGYDGVGGGSKSLNVSVDFLGAALPFAGRPGGQTLMMNDLPFYPPSSPPLPPPPPPGMPVTHSCKQAFDAGATASGVCLCTARSRDRCTCAC